MQKVLALAQARKVDVILVTELRFVASAGMGSKPTYLVRWWLRSDFTREESELSTN
jgi:hypothetical protein